MAGMTGTHTLAVEGVGEVSAFCSDGPTAVEGGWTLFMTNGKDKQHKMSLIFSANSGGIGSVATVSETGAHKMSHAAVNAMAFKESALPRPASHNNPQPPTPHPGSSHLRINPTPMPP
jgi:hypothetical protein